MNTLALMRRDPIWKFIPWATLGGLATFFWTADSPFFRGGAIGLVTSLYFFMLAQGKIHERASSFEAALPIDGRDIIRARLASLLLYLWLPVAVSLGVAAISGIPAAAKLAWPVCAAAMAATGAVVFFQLYRLPALSLRRWTALAAWSVIVSTALTFPVWPASVKSVWILVCAASAIGAYALSAWPRGPLAFQTTSAELRAASTASPLMVGSISPWRVVVRSLCSWQTIVWLSFAVIYPLLNNLLLPLFFVPMYVTASYLSTRWLFPLPFSRKTLASLIVLPLLGVYSLSAFSNLSWEFWPA